MSSSLLHEAVVDLGWSLWTELGVPGVIRRHQQVVIDPEPIIVASPTLFPLDPRLRDQVYGWCAAHADRISASRLQGLLSTSPPPMRDAFTSFAATLRRHAKVRWPVPDDADAWGRVPEAPTPRLPIARPALLRLRLRALCGVGARADVTCALLSRTSAWTRASDLASDGYSKRNVARILSELAEAGLVKSVREGNVISFQLDRAETLGELVGGQGLAFPEWRLIMSLVARAMELEGLESRPESVRRVEAHKQRNQLSPIADLLRLAAPPTTRGNPDAWEETMAWAAHRVAELADGSSPAFRTTPSPTVRHSPS
jgi:DNA-binding transcriptional ArsR family regulator